jgi:hypothetical protein
MFPSKRFGDERPAHLFRLVQLVSQSLHDSVDFADQGTVLDVTVQVGFEHQKVCAYLPVPLSDFFQLLFNLAQLSPLQGVEIGPCSDRFYLDLTPVEPL